MIKILLDIIMVCLNEYITFNKLKLQKNIIENVVDNVNRNYYFYGIPKLERIDENIREKITNSIVNDVNKIIKNTIKNLFSSDHFIYVNMKDDLCTYKHKKGKNEGYICCKRITKNGCKKNYVCTKHNKYHTPMKKGNTKKNNASDITTYIETKNQSNSDNKVILCGRSHGKIFKNKFKNKKKYKNKIIIHGEINFKNIFSKLLI